MIEQTTETKFCFELAELLRRYNVKICIEQAGSGYGLAPYIVFRRESHLPNMPKFNELFGGFQGTDRKRLNNFGYTDPTVADILGE